MQRTREEAVRATFAPWWCEWWCSRFRSFFNHILTHFIGHFLNPFLNNFATILKAISKPKRPKKKQNKPKSTVRILHAPTSFSYKNLKKPPVFLSFQIKIPLKKTSGSQRILPRDTQWCPKQTWKANQNWTIFNIFLINFSSQNDIQN